MLLVRFLPLGWSGNCHERSSCDELVANTVGGWTPAGALSEVLAVLCGLTVHPPPVQAWSNQVWQMKWEISVKLKQFQQQIIEPSWLINIQLSHILLSSMVVFFSRLHKFCIWKVLKMDTSEVNLHKLTIKENGKLFGRMSDITRYNKAWLAGIVEVECNLLAMLKGLKPFVVYFPVRFTLINYRDIGSPWQLRSKMSPVWDRGSQSPWRDRRCCRRVPRRTETCPTRAARISLGYRSPGSERSTGPR